MRAPSFLRAPFAFARVHWLSALVVLGLGIAGLGIAYKYRWPIYFMALKTFVYPPLSPAQLGDGGPASKLTLFHPGGILRDATGNTYISDRGGVKTGRPFQGSVIWKIDADGIAHAIAGTGDKNVMPGNIRALDADLRSVEEMQFDDRGRVIFVDHKYGVVWRIERDGMLTRLAGNGKRGYSGDGGPAVDASFNKPYGLTRDASGSLYISDAENHVIRVLRPDGTVDTVAGNGTPGYSGDGGPATAAQLSQPYNTALDSAGRLLIGDSQNHVIRRVEKDGIITTIVGTGKPGYSGDGGDARAATLNGPQFMQEVDGHLYIGDEHNHAIRVVDPNGIISTVIGTGKPGFAKDGTLAREAPMFDPEGFLVNSDGTFLILDSRNHRVLRIDEQGRVFNFAGRGRDTDKLGRDSVQASH